MHEVNPAISTFLPSTSPTDYRVLLGTLDGSTLTSLKLNRKVDHSPALLPHHFHNFIASEQTTENHTAFKLLEEWIDDIKDEDGIISYEDYEANMKQFLEKNSAEFIPKIPGVDLLDDLPNKASLLDFLIVDSNSRPHDSYQYPSNKYLTSLQKCRSVDIETDSQVNILSIL